MLSVYNIQVQFCERKRARCGLPPRIASVRAPLENPHDEHDNKNTTDPDHVPDFEKDKAYPDPTVASLEKLAEPCAKRRRCRVVDPDSVDLEQAVKAISCQSIFIFFEIKFNFWGQASWSPMFSLLLSSLLPAPSPPPSSLLLLPLLLLPYIHLVIAFVIAIVIAFMIAFVIAFCDSNFGPDQLHNVIHFNIRSTFDLCMYMHRSTLVYIYICVRCIYTYTHIYIEIYICKKINQYHIYLSHILYIS